MFLVNLFVFLIFNELEKTSQVIGLMYFYAKLRSYRMWGSIKQIPLLGQFLILIGLYLIGEYVFLMLAIGLIDRIYPQMDFMSFVTNMNNITSADQVTQPQTDALKIYQFITSFGRFVCVALIFIYISGEKFITYLQLNKKLKFSSVLLILLLFFASVSVISLINEWNQNLHFPSGMSDAEASLRKMEDQAKIFSDVFLNTTTVSGLIINILLIGVLAAVGEEIFFRGLLQNLFLKGIGNAHIAIWLSAFLFSFIHFQFFGFFPRMLLGAMLGYLFYWSGSLWAAILAHFINNVVSVIAYYLVNIGAVDENMAEQSSVVAALVSVPFVVILLIVFKRNEKVNLASDGAGLDDGVLDNG